MIAVVHFVVRQLQKEITEWICRMLRNLRYFFIVHCYYFSYQFRMPIV